MSASAATLPTTLTFEHPDRSVLRHQLDNGLRVVLEEDHRLPLVAVNLRYDVGSRDEAPGRTGFAHLFEHVMFEGSRNVAAGEHFAVLQAAGATLNATTSFDRTTYFETVPSTHLELALWLEADRMAALDLTDETFENQRAVVKNERRQRYDDQPYGDTSELLYQLAYPIEHPYRHLPIGHMADLDAATLADAAAFHERWYAPDTCVLSIVGDVDGDRVLDLVEQYFGDIPGRGGTPGHPPPRIFDGLADPVRQSVVARVPAPQLTIGIRVPRDDESLEHDAVDVLARALGRGRGSRLYRALVVERELVQPTTSLLGCAHLTGDATLLVFRAQARSGVAIWQIEAAVEEVLAEVASSGITDQELERVRVMGRRGHELAMATVTSRADRYGKVVTEHGDLVHAFDSPARLDAVTTEHVVAAAGRWLVPANRAVVVHVPAEER